MASPSSKIAFLAAANAMVGGVVIASGGSGFQAVALMIATGASGFAASRLVIQSQAGEQRWIEAEGKRLNQEVQRLKQTSKFGVDLEHLQQQKESLKQDIKDLEQKRENLETRVQQIQHNPPNLEELEQRQQKLGELRMSIHNCQGQLEAVQAQITEREQQRDQLTVITHQFLKKQSDIDSLKEDIRELNQEAAALELFRSTYDALCKDKEKLEAQQQHLKAEIPRLEQERDRILGEIGTMEEKARKSDALRAAIERLKAELRDKESELKSLKRQIDQLISEKSILEDEVARKKATVKELEEKISELKGEISKLKGEIKEIENSTKQAFQALTQPIKLDANHINQLNDESEFLDKFKQYLSRKGLVFPKRVIYAFHTSLKVQDISALVILAGISGTGKSELPQAYAEFMGSPLVMLPVQPRWDSPQDLQGFYNYIEKKYKPTSLMHYLYQHEHSENLNGRIVLVLLDEMNLARVEYYFSDFLSKLETRRNKPTYLDLEMGSLNVKEDEKRVIIPHQFLFVGTMNEDETTQSLSDKVLDRANVLTFGRPQELKLREGQRTKPPLPTEYISWDTFQDWTKDTSQNPGLTEAVKDYVNRANDIMESLGRPFAHRVFQAFAKYVVNYPGADGDEVIRKQAIADQFGQKILPKLRGIMVEETESRKALNKMQSLLSELGDDALNQAFENARKGQYGQFQWKGMVYHQD